MTKITIDRALVEQALEALEWHYRQGHSNTLGGLRLKIDEKALRNLRAALAQPVEPVPQPGVWMHPWPPVRAQRAEPTPPLEAFTEAEKTAYAAGWWAATAEIRGGGNLPPPLQAEPVAWRCACGANLYIGADGAPSSGLRQRSGGG